MPISGEILVGIVLIFGLLGTVAYVVPGLIIQLGALFLWALTEGGVVPWTVAIVSLLIAMTATIVKYLIPGRRLKEAGVPMVVLAPATLMAIVGFFAVPVIGAPIFFIGTVYLIELFRVGRKQAWPTTKASVAAFALSVGIEFAAALLILGIWVLSVIAT
ncbi:MAG: DUF456 domain-containing protein [Acidimicrobiia bacterium]